VPVVPRGHRATTKLKQENYFNPAPMGPEKYWIIKYSGLSNSTYTDLNS